MSIRDLTEQAKQLWAETTVNVAGESGHIVYTVVADTRDFLKGEDDKDVLRLARSTSSKLHAYALGLQADKTAHEAGRTEATQDDYLTAAELIAAYISD